MATAIAQAAVSGFSFALVLQRVESDADGVRWLFRTATIGSGWVVTVDDATDVAYARHWGVR